MHEANPTEISEHALARAADSVVVARLVNLAISHRDMPVSGVRVYRRDSVVVKSLPEGIVPPKPKTREEPRVIKEFSERSRYRLLHTAKNCDVDFRSMATLTYPAEFPCDGKLVKTHLDKVRKRLAREFKDIRGIWFLEFQRRGAPHFHWLFSVALEDRGELVSKRRRSSKRDGAVYWTHQPTEDWLSRAWYEVVGSGDQKHLRAGCSWELIEEEDGAIRYAATHAAKPHQKEVPENYQNVGRFWGVIGNVQVPLVSVKVMDTQDVIREFGHDALSRKGRVKKYLWDSSERLNTEKPEERLEDEP